jgi:hypothetical protein
MAIKIPIFSDYDNKGVRDAEGAFEAFGTKIGNIAKTAAVAFAAVGTAAAVGAFKAIQKASDLAESVSKIDTIFGEGAQGVADFSKTAAKELGISEQSVYDAAGTFGVFGKAAGLGGQDLTDFSNKFTTLSADLASFNNTSPEDAMQAIGAALRGESEPLRRYGVMLDDAALKAEAMAQGIYDGKGPLTQQQKVLAATGAIFKQTNDAQGDFAKTSGGLANQQRIFKAQLDNVVTTIGTKLLPIFMKIVGFISDKILPAIQLLTSAFEKDGIAGIVKIVQGQLPKLKTVLGNAVSTFADWLKDAYPPALRAVLEMFYDLGQWLLNTGLPALAKLLGDGAEAFWNWIKEAAPPALKRLAELMADLANWILDKGLPTLVDKLIVLGNALVDWIKPQIVPALKALGDLLLTILNWVVTEAVPKLGAQAVKIGGALLGWVAQLLPEAVAGLTKFVADLVVKIPGLFFSLIATMVNLGTRLGTDLVSALVEALKGLGSKGLDVGKAFGNGIIRFINNNVIKKINDLLDFTIPLPFGKSLTINPPDLGPIPELAEGGIVTGPTLAMIGEGNGPEAVIPLSKLGSMGFGGGGGGITVNVNGGDPNSIVRALQQYVRQSGPVPVNTRAM